MSGEQSVSSRSLKERKRPVTVEIETVGTEACPYGECDGSGRICYVEREPENTEYPLGHGLYAGPATTYGTHLCRCRQELEPRDGEARWWTTESVYSAEWESGVHQHVAEISVTAEVPISDENYVVHRRGNRYYPTMVDVDFDTDWLHALFPDEARELAAKLVEAANACDAIDKPDTNPDGTWWFPE